jgi:hypothetical protein
VLAQGIISGVQDVRGGKRFFISAILFDVLSRLKEPYLYEPQKNKQLYCVIYRIY